MWYCWKKVERKCNQNFPILFASLDPFLCRSCFQSNPISNSTKIHHPPQKTPSGVPVAWNFTGQFLWKVALAMESKNSKRSFCTSFSDKAILARAGFSHYILNGLKVGRGITGQDCSSLSRRADHSAKNSASISNISFNPKCSLLSISAYLRNSGLTYHKVITLLETDSSLWAKSKSCGKAALCGLDVAIDLASKVLLVCLKSWTPVNAMSYVGESSAVVCML